MWDCCINPQVLRDAISHRTVKSILIQTCLGLVEERDDIVLSRQFVLPKLAAKGTLEETKVPRAMLENPIVASSGNGQETNRNEGSGQDQDLFGSSKGIASILQQQQDQELALTEAVIPAIESATRKAISPAGTVSSSPVPTSDLKPKKLLIQEIGSSNETAPVLSYKKLSECLYEVYGCSEEFAEGASVSYLPKTHALLLKSSAAFDTLTVNIAVAAVPGAIRALYNKKIGALRILVTPRS